MIKVATAVLLAALALPAAAQQAVPPSADDGKASFRMGVVNLKTCFEKDKYERIKEVDAELEKKLQEFQKRLDDIQRRMQRLDEEIKQLPRESSLRTEKIRDLKRAESDLKVERELGRAQYLDFYNDRKIEVYNKVRQAVDVVARAEKLDLVLRVETPMLEEQDTPNVATQINSRVVLFAQESCDITPLVLKHLNAEYAKEKGAKGGGK